MHGYRKKPGWIYAIAASYALAPIFCAWQLAARADYDRSLLTELLIDPQFFLIEAGLALSCAVAVLLVTRLSFVCLVLISSYVIAQKVHGLVLHGPFDSPFELVAATLWLGVTLAIVATTLRRPYLNPKARWWNQPQRFRSVALGVLQRGGLHFPIVSLDLSSSGAFVKLDERLLSAFMDGPEDEPNPEDRRKHPSGGEALLSHEELARAGEGLDAYPSRLGEHVSLRLQTEPEGDGLFPDRCLNAEAEVVWSARPGSPHRFGLGLRFVHREREERTRLRTYLRRLRDAGLARRR